jgi:hypothetical protein
LIEPEPVVSFRFGSPKTEAPLRLSVPSCEFRWRNVFAVGKSYTAQGTDGNLHYKATSPLVKLELQKLDGRLGWAPEVWE